MGRVRLHSGGISPGQVRLGSRGASERLRAPGDDINSRDASQTAAVCGWCGTARQVDPYLRPRRCAACRADEQQVAAAAAKLKGAGLPPLGARVPDGTRLAKVRRQGDAAHARLAERRKGRTKPPAAKATATKAAGSRTPAKGAPPRPKPSTAPASGPRRVTEAERRAARSQLVASVARIERELAAPRTAPSRRDLLREKLAAAQGLLRNWDAID